MVEPIIERIPLHVDDRGSVYCALDNIGTLTTAEEWNRKQIKRTYVVHNWEKGRIRAWHGHMKAWTGMHVIHGAAKLVARPIDDEGTIKSVVFSDKNPGILWVPPGYYNGSMSLQDNTKILVYSTLSFEEVKNDDYRAALTHNDVVQFFRVLDR